MYKPPHESLLNAHLYDPASTDSSPQALNDCTQGFGALYAGVLPALISVAPSGAVFYGTYDLLKVHTGPKFCHVLHILQKNSRCLAA